MKIKYCTKCLMPSAKPYISFNEKGVCNACLAHEIKNNAIEGIDWDKRMKKFCNLIEWAKAKDAPYYDAMVPVSGGKDSMTQVHRLLGHGLRILAVNVDYGIKTQIGKYNLERIPEMGANLLIIRPEMKLHKRLIRLGLEEFGDPDLLSHTLLHAYPINVALRFQIPLAALGENSAFEYGGSNDVAKTNTMTRAWFDKFAANKGMTAKVISKNYNIPYRQLWQYDLPDEIEDSTKTRAVFLSYYFHWDSEEHFRIAKKYGFKALNEPREGTYRTYVGIDEMINRVHQYQKVLKFGYGRTSDHACEDIRNGYISREEGKKLVRKYDLQDLGEEYILAVSQFLNYSCEEFIEIIEQSRNLEIWKKDSRGRWIIPGHLQD